MLPSTKIKGWFCNMSSYKQPCWTVLLTSSRLPVYRRIMVLSAALCTALAVKCGKEESFCHHRRYGMGHQSSPSPLYHFAQQRNKAQAGGVGHFIRILLNCVFFLPSTNGPVDFPRDIILNSKGVHLFAWILWWWNLLSLLNHQFQYHSTFLLGQCSTLKPRAWQACKSQALCGQALCSIHGVIPPVHLRPS